MMQQGGGEPVLREVVREVAKMDTKTSAETQTFRNASQFLSETCEIIPETFIPLLPMLITFIEQEVSV